MPNDAWIRYQKWSVFWYSEKKKRFVRKRFYEDLGKAIQFYTMKQGLPGLTLHTDNHGYPPPTRITEHVHEKWIVVEQGGKRYKKRVTETVNLMAEYNRKGIWWCPYCIQLRRFKLTEAERGPEMFCPVCGCGNHLSDVRRHNPQASVIEMHKRERKTESVKPRRRRK